MSIWEVRKPTTHMRKLCKCLGAKYSIRVIDFERVIYRDLGNGYDIEVSGMNTTSLRKKATIYLWKNKKIIVRGLKGVSQDSIDKYVEELKNFAESLTEKDFDSDGFYKGKRYIHVSK